MSDRKRLLTDLRVIDLRAELEKRNLDKSGVRGVLIQRLSKYLEIEGHDPATYRFDLSGSEPKSTPVKKSRRSESAVEAPSEETPTMEDMIVQDDVGDEEETEVENEEKKPPAETETKTEPETAKGPATADDSMDVDSAEKINRKRENKDETEATQAKKPCPEKEDADEHKTENNTDADDSINLDIGDDELLNEETESTSKDMKDGRETGRAAPSERPALAQLLTDIDVDDGATEEAAVTARDESAPDETAAAADDQPAEDQQVNNADADAPATSNDGDNADKDKDDKHKDGDKKDRKDESKEGGARNLWVSGLSGDTRAKDLKQLCSKHGKVIGAKVVTNARTPGSRCYGYVTMASAQDAENCIKNLHRTELHGRMISVEKAKSEAESASRRQPSRSDRHSSVDRKEDGKDNEDNKEGDKSEKKKDDGTESNRSTSRTREKSHRSDKDKTRRSTRSRERRRSEREVLSFSKIWKQRDEARARERSRAAREEERRRRAAEEALRERERRQRQEKHRLALEREKLRAEREKIEREKNELLKLERERHRLEREKLELERLELKRAQLRLEEERRKRGYESSAPYRKPASSPPPEPAYERERHKRVPPPPLSSSRSQFEAPPPPRFDMSANYDRGSDKRDRDRDYKRDYPRHVSSGNIKYGSNGSTNDVARQPMPPSTRPKEPARSYEPRDGRSYRPSTPGKPEPRSWNASSRFPEAAPPTKGSGGGASGEAWSGSEPRYGSGGGGAYEARYPPAYQPPPPGAPYPDRYAPQREYRKY